MPTEQRARMAAGREAALRGAGLRSRQAPWMDGLRMGSREPLTRVGQEVCPPPTTPLPTCAWNARNVFC